MTDMVLGDINCRKSCRYVAFLQEKTDKLNEQHRKKCSEYEKLRYRNADLIKQNTELRKKVGELTYELSRIGKNTEDVSKYKSQIEELKRKNNELEVDIRKYEKQKENVEEYKKKIEELTNTVKK